MERVAWTDERLDDLARRMDGGFDRIDADIRELRAELHTEVAGLKATMMWVGGGIMIGLVGVIATLLAAGG